MAVKVKCGGALNQVFKGQTDKMRVEGHCRNYSEEGNSFLNEKRVLPGGSTLLALQKETYII